MQRNPVRNQQPPLALATTFFTDTQLLLQKHSAKGHFHILGRKVTFKKGFPLRGHLFLRRNEESINARILMGKEAIFTTSTGQEQRRTHAGTLVERTERYTKQTLQDPRAITCVPLLWLCALRDFLCCNG